MKTTMKTIAAAMLMSLAAHTASQAAVIAVSGYTDDGSYGLTSVTINSTRTFFLRKIASSPI